LAEAVGDEHTFLTTFQWESAFVQASAGRYEEAIGLAEAGQQAAERLGRARSRGSMLAVTRAIPLRLLGRWDEAEEIALEALADNPPPHYAAFLRLVIADIARCRGDADRFETLLGQLTEFARHARGAAEARIEIAMQRIAWALDQNDPELADRILGEQLAQDAVAGQPPDVMRLLVFGARVQMARRAAAHGTAYSPNRPTPGSHSWPACSTHCPPPARRPPPTGSRSRQQPRPHGCPPGTRPPRPGGNSATGTKPHSR
jgi:tetratricopeptide (TPR) repeat protein